jgi:FtsP/CotA-like multicopper oxidase with cupredoxin domain
MKRKRIGIGGFLVTALAAVAISFGGAPGWAQLDPGGIPHYFGPYANWAYSPLPTGSVTGITVTAPGTGYTAPAVEVTDFYGAGTGVVATVTLDPAGAITGITLSSGGSGFTLGSTPVVTITDTVGTGAAATATIGGFPVGGLRKFIDNVPLLGPAGANNLGQYIPVAVADNTSYPTSDYYEIALVEFNEKMHSSLPPTRHRGYVQLETTANYSVSKHIALANPDGTPILMPNGTQAIAVDNPHFLGPTIVATGSVPGQPGRPVRLKFHNLLPTGAGGDLFLPVDPTVMGAGVGPKDALGNDCDPMMPPMPGMPACEMYAQNRATVHLHGNNSVWISDGTTHQWTTPAGETTPYPMGVSARNVPDMPDPGPGALTFFYTNAQSARLMFYHDHAMGITRLNVYAGEAAGYVLTDPVEQDLINGTNLSGVNPTGVSVLPDIGIPLVIQDRTFVDNATIAAQDPTWNWGTGPRDPATGKITAAVTGDLWYPHVYMPAQNPWNPDLSGMNPFGRWHYGPWFYPPTTFLAVGPVPNPYYQPDPALPGYSPLEPPLMPGIPNPSMAGEAFMDTPVVNGTVYPYLEVDPKAYRFRILNAADDRFFNLQMYVAADRNSQTTAGTTDNVLCDGINPVAPGDCTEVRMVPVGDAPNQLADIPSGLPDPATKGPDWIQIGTEGGFLPAPVVIPSQPIGWNTNPTTFNVGNVNQHSLLLGTAERADVIVDFSAYAGKTLILYNDAPAAFPAGVSTYDYYTGTPDQTDAGGAPTTQPGYGPNTRTVMQIRVKAAAPAPAYDVVALEAAFAKTVTKRGVFEVSQDPIILPQAAYNSAYDVTNLPVTPLDNAYVLQNEPDKTFRPINNAGVLLSPVTLPVEPKALHDEMGGVYDAQYGRMSGMIGLQLPATQSRLEQFLPYGYASPPVDIVKGSVSGDPIGSLADGTQIWKITHNGVDTHTIHTHLFNGQLLNRVAWDGALLPPDPNELGWKDTFRVNPLEHTIIALRPIVPTPAQVPFEVPNSIRLIDPTLPPGAMLIPPPPAGWFDPLGNQLNDADMVNHEVNFGWEYVWHCHILAHEEMDMMHSLAFVVPPSATPSPLSAALIGNGNNRSVVLNWTDVGNATNFTVQRATNVSFTNNLLTFPLGKVTTHTNPIGSPNQTFYYRVFASNVVGDTAVYPGSLGFPKETLTSGSSNIAPYPATAPLAAPAAPSPVNATAAPQGNNARVTLTWTNVANESGYRIQRATDAAFTSGVVNSTVGANVITFTTGNLPRATDFYFRVQAFNSADPSAWVNANPFPVRTP